jgi:tRNA threonylcarbamoyladenosine biosynthesis protein TsaB
MNYILNIHTTAEKAIVNLTDKNRVLTTTTNERQKDHASFLHIAIKKILQDNDIAVNQLKAIGVTGGPGSYTGIRVGLATAKGLCFALKIPMMMFNSLELMAFCAIESFRGSDIESLFCPMIDARRMEVFTAVYDKNLNEVNAPTALVLNENSFDELAQNKNLYYFGSGAEKFKKLVETRSEKFNYILSDISSESLANFSWKKFEKNDFENIIKAQALYVKEFYTTAKIG